MKKSLILLLTVGMLAGTLAGCTNTNEAAASGDATAASGDATAASGDETAPDGTEEVSGAVEKSYDGLTIRIGDNVDGSHFAIADSLGFWEDEFGADGIKVEGTAFANGPAFVDALATDQIDFGSIGDQPAISAFAAGKGLKVIGIYNVSDAGAIYAHADSGIETVQDLEGKKVAYAAGTAGEKMLKKILDAEGMAEDAIEAINLSGTDAVVAFGAGDVDAVVYYGNFYSNFEDDSNIVKVANYADYGRIVGPIVVSDSFADRYPELTARVLKVFAREAEWLADNREEAIALLEEYGQYTEENAIIRYEQDTFGVAFSEADAEALNDTAQFLYDSGIIDHAISTDDFVDTQYLREAGLLE